MRKAVFFIILLLVLAGLVWVAAFLKTKNEKNYAAGGKIRVVATIFPLYDFARAVGGDKANVSMLMPPGVEPHSFEPKPSDIAQINEANIFFYTGKVMEPWAEKIMSAIAAPKFAAVDASAKINLIPAAAKNTDVLSVPDPHIWLDFANDKIIIDEIAAAISQKDPANAGYYSQNAAAYKAKLDRLDAEYRSGLANCATREIIYGGHYAFGYMAKRYDLKYFAAEGISPDAEPTAGDLIKLTEQIRRDKIRYVFFEELTSPKIAQTIAAETDAQLLLLNAGHNVSRDQMDAGETFIDIMEKDLINLKTGLQCQ